MSAEIIHPPVVPDPRPAAPQTPEDLNSTSFAVPDIVSKGTTMTKISENGRKRVLFRVDPDEGKLLYKSRKNGIGKCFLYELYV